MKAYSAPGMIAAGQQKDPVLTGVTVAAAVSVAAVAAVAIGIVGVWVWMSPEE